MNIAITGASGFIGSHLVKRLTDRHTLTIFHKRKHSLGNVQTLESFVKDQDVIIHLAGLVYDTTEHVYTVNVIGTHNVLRAIVRYGKKNAKVIFSSSFAVYKPIHTKTLLTEQSTVQPTSDYGVSKREAEKLIQRYTQQRPMQGIVLRLANVYGPGAKRQYSVINRFMSTIVQSQPIIVNGDGTQARDFIYIDDVVDAVRRAITYNKKKFLLCNICTGVETKLLDVVKGIEQITHKKARVRFHQEVKEIGYWIGDGALAAKELGFHARIDVSSGLIKTIEYI